MFKRYFTKLVHAELLRILNDKSYVKRLKEVLQDDMVKCRATENEAYLRDMSRGNG